MTLLHSVVFSIQGFDQELLGLVLLFWDLFVLGTHTLRKGGSDDTLVGPFGTLGGGQRSCHLLFSMWCLFWLRFGAFHCYITIPLTLT